MICTLFDAPIGATFIDWSIRYLSGDKLFFNIKEDDYISVISVPLTNKNIHLHKRNEVKNNKQLKSYRNKFEQVITSSYHSTIALSWVNERNSKTIKKQQVDLQDMINDMIFHKDHIILLDISNPLYLIRDNTRAGISDSIYSRYNKINDLTNIWDMREILALSMRLYISPFKALKKDFRHYLIKNHELFYNLSSTIDDIMNFVEIVYNKNKLEHWVNIYKQWQQLHHDEMIYTLYFDDIIQYIVNGHDLDLSRFNLDLAKEAYILHVLIYEYDLNIKSNKLDKFPNNTKEIHQLLEPNIHIL